jgi:hypothetical protein
MGFIGQSKVMLGLELEQFLIQFAQSFISQGATEWPPSAVPMVIREVIVIARYQLAGFSKVEVLNEIAPSFVRFSDQQMNFVYEEVAGAIKGMVLASAETGERFGLKVWNVRESFGVPHDRSIEHARIGAISKPMMGFVKGEYKICVDSGMQGAAAFGGPMFFQLWIIGNLRLKNLDGARIAAEAAQNCLQVVSPWHGRLVDLTLGNTTASELNRSASDDQMRYQVKCFEALRLYTGGDTVSAARLLKAAASERSDLIVESAMVAADLDRAGR